MRNILVTGGAGYIGSHTCKQLWRFGYNPIVYDNLSTGHAEFVKWGELVVGDLLDTEKIKLVFKQYCPVAVIHFAASAYVGESVINPFKYYKNNVGGTISLLDAMISMGVKNLIFSSTCATYGVPDVLLISENVPQNPINPYGRSKLIVESILKDLAERGLIQHVALRYFNAAGADHECEIGEWHEPETHLIPLAISSAMGGAKLKIFGNRFQTSDGTAVRDYIHVDDLASGHLKALEYLLSGNPSDQINLGTGQGVSVMTIVKTLCDIGLNPTYEYVDCRKGDPGCLVADSKKAKSLLGWQPVYTDLASILRTAVKWQKKLMT